MGDGSARRAAGKVQEERVEPDFGRVDERAEDLREPDPMRDDEQLVPDWIGETEIASSASGTIETVGAIVRDHPVAGAAGALTGAITGTAMGGPPGTVVGAAAGAARGVVVAEALKKVGEKLEEANILQPDDRADDVPTPPRDEAPESA
jgi:hypothetical protein